MSFAQMRLETEMFMLEQRYFLHMWEQRKLEAMRIVYHHRYGF